VKSDTRGYPFSGIAMWPSSHEQSHGCAPGRSRLHEGDAVPVLSILSTNTKINGDGTGFVASLSRRSCRHIAPNRRGLPSRASYLDESRSTYLICIGVGTLYHAIFCVVAISVPIKTCLAVVVCQAADRRACSVLVAVPPAL
jgi:hypothetical protein